jgi:hypothetical protein
VVKFGNFSEEDLRRKVNSFEEVQQTEKYAPIKIRK